jgi:predicted aminopeptidase
VCGLALTFFTGLVAPMVVQAGEHLNFDSISMHANPLQSFQIMSWPLSGTRRWLSRCLVGVTGLTCSLLGAGCADTSYYLQSVGGHLKMMQLARPVDQWLLDDALEPALKQRLVLAQRIRRFSVSDLSLPDNASYQRYADLQRRVVVWNVVAASELSLTLKTWCFPVAGCVGYRGYFSEVDAQAQAAHLKAQGLEVSVYGVPAYSTLGWLNWAGGDPLLNTFIRYPEGELARMIFHELAHQVLYVKDDTVFNESFATAVERLGGEGWLAAHGSPQARAEYAVFDTRRRQFRALLMTTRKKLARIYSENMPLTVDKQAQIAMKNIAMQEFRANFLVLKAAWGGYTGYDAWVAGANNAAFGAQAVYDDLVPDFEALFVAQGRDWMRFYEAVKQLAQLPAVQRVQTLKQLSTEHSSG